MAGNSVPLRTGMPQTAQIVAMSGNPLSSRSREINSPPPNFNYSGGGGDEPMTPIWKLDIRRDVQLAKWGVAALGTIFFAAFIFILTLIDSRFDKADGKIGAVSEQVSDLRVEIVTQTTDIKLLLEKQNDSQFERGSRNEQPNAVRQRTPARP